MTPFSNDRPFPQPETGLQAAAFSSPAVRRACRTLALCAIALIAGLAVLGAPGTALADEPECEVIDLGAIGGETAVIETEGRWTTEDCDSAFRQGSDGHTYRFEVSEPGRVRVGLTSAEADSYLYLLAEDGRRIADNDDGAPHLGARVERDLDPGTYLVEATTVGGRSHGPADFELTIGYVASCDPIDLGALEPGASLTASGVWTIETCASRFVATHPAYTYAFHLPQEGRVRIDLVSDDGDPVLSLMSPTQGIISANDDWGGGSSNSRIDQYLSSGLYLIEATTYHPRDSNLILTDFTLTVSFIAADSFLIKIEALEIPDVVIAGEPFTVHYRVGNPGHTDLPEGLTVQVLADAPGSRSDWTRSVPAGGGQWGAGVSYHSGAEAAGWTSSPLPALRPLRLNIPKPGDSYVVLVIFTDDDETGQEVDVRFFERLLSVHSGPTFGPRTVTVDGSDFEVKATADDERIVTNRVTSVAEPGASVDPTVQAKAIYAAAVGTFLLDGIFERPALEGLSATAEPLETTLADAASTTLYEAFWEQYAEAIAAAGFERTLALGEIVHPAAVEDFVLDLARRVSRQYAWLAASWRALEEQVAGGDAISFAQAVAVQSELAYAERIVAPAVAAGRAVQAAREAEAGWEDPAVQALVDELAALARCDSRSTLVADSFPFGSVGGGLEAVEAELRASSPICGLGSDAALCAASAVDRENARFLRRLGISSDPVVGSLHVPRRPPPAEDQPTPPYELRVVARLMEDGRVEHGVQLANFQQVLPPRRMLPVDATAGRWYVSGDVEVDGRAIGVIRARRLGDGRIELGFRDVDGDRVAPAVRYLPADLPIGVWVRSSVIEVAPPPLAENAPE